MLTGVLAGVRDRSITTPDGRTIAWTEYGEPGGTPLLRMPGTPASRLAVRADRTPWDDRGLFVVTTERPGYGASTRLPGRGLRQPSDDVSRILDRVGLDRVHLMGQSGGGPHVLAYAGFHGARVRAATVVAGAVEMSDEEAEDLIPLNQQARARVLAGDRAGLESLLSPVRESVLTDARAAFEGIFATAPPEDREILESTRLLEVMALAAGEGLRHGVDGWADETLVLGTGLEEIPYAEVSTSVTWWHAPHDRNCPYSAVRRVLDRLPDARLVTMDGGHLAGYLREPEILDELLARG